MAGATDTMWDAQAKNQNADAVSRLSQMVAGNDHLVTQPGLVQALFENNATPQQAQAINQFVGGLNAEQLVRTAGAAGQKINLSDEQQESLDAMGIEYKSVLFTQQDAVSELTSKMAAAGVKPVLDPSGSIQTDAAGNPLTQPLAKPKKSKGGRGFFGTIGHGLAAPFEAIGHVASKAWTWTDAQVSSDLKGLISPFTSPEMASGQADQIAHGGGEAVTTAAPIAVAASQNDALASSLGYDPNSFFSMQAFTARGLAHRDTSAVAQKWDDANPQGLFGWDGSRAVTEAESFAADPVKYRKQIIDNADLTPDQVATKLQAVNSDQFRDVVLRVNADRSGIGNDVANAVGIDPVHHSTLFNVVSTGTDLAASFAIDPLSVGLSAYRTVQVSSAAMHSLADAGAITRILKPANGVGASVAQRRVIAHLNDMVDQTKAIKAATDAGDTVKAARLNQSLQSSNPFAGLLGDFLGRDQIVGLKSEQEVAKLGKGELPFITGTAAPIETFDKAVEYLASKSALLRLQGGYAPVEASVMPGALSSYGFLKLKGALTGWSAGRTAAKAEAAAAKFVASAKTDPGRLETLIDKGLLTRTLPADDDAVDALTGKVIAARHAAETAGTFDEFSQGVSDLASATRAHAAATGDIAITDAGRGQLRGNQLRYGLYEAPETSARQGRQHLHPRHRPAGQAWSWPGSRTGCRETPPSTSPPPRRRTR
jgi:hypothetical protein